MRAIACCVVVVALLVGAAASTARQPQASDPLFWKPQMPAGSLYTAAVPRSSAGPLELEATVTEYPNVIANEISYPSFAPNGTKEQTRWRVVTGTGNCCENYIATTPQGRIYDFGSTYLVFSDDEGKSWSQVRPQRTAAAIGGEGTVVLAPNGDVVGVTWIPYGGDRVETFKYDAERDKWLYSYAALHHPFYDRESVAVIPGPIEHLGEKHPYMVVMRGGWPSKNPWYYSFDGLTYFRPNHRAIDSATRPPVSRWLDVKPDRSLDWIQPAVQTTLTPLGKGFAVAMPDDYRLGSTRMDIFDEQDLGWSPLDLPRGELDRGLGAKLLADSTGRLHYVYATRRKTFYMLSTDGGRSWKKHLVPMPFEGARTWSQDNLDEDDETYPPEPRFEFVANGRLGVAALSMQIHDPKKQVHINYVYRYEVRSDRAELKRIYQVGDGDLEFGNDVTAGGARMDFQSVGLLPDGRIVVSFGDQAHSSPNLAIER